MVIVTLGERSGFREIETNGEVSAETHLAPMKLSVAAILILAVWADA